jgi:serine/threonine-protein kinase
LTAIGPSCILEHVKSVAHGNGADGPRAAEGGSIKVPASIRGYTFERPLGKGGMGSVWLARKLSTHQTFAIKFLNEDLLDDASYLARFEREIAALRAIRHPNVVNVFEWSMARDGEQTKPYVVMEMLEGEGLEDLLRRQRTVPPPLSVTITLQVLDGLAAAHNVGVVHRDLSPSNVHLTRQPSGSFLVRLLDFGLARPVAREEGVQVTEAGTLMGRPGYMAPETFKQQPADHRIDIFACGMMLYRMLAGRLPFREAQGNFLWAERYAETMHQREYTPIHEFAEWVPENLAQCVTKAIRRNPDERYQTCEEMQVDLLDIEDSELSRAAQSAPAPPPGLLVPAGVMQSQLVTDQQPAVRPGRRWLVIGGSAVAAGALLVVLLTLGGGGSEGTTPSDARTAPHDDVLVASTAEGSRVVLPPAPTTADVGPTAPDAATGPTAGLASADAATDTIGTAGEAEATTEEARTVLIVVTGVPAGSAIKIGALVPEGDPPRVRVPWAEDPLQLTIEARGFEKYSEAILPTADRVMNVHLRPIRRPPPGRRDAGSVPEDDFPEFPGGRP